MEGDREELKSLRVGDLRAFIVGMDDCAPIKMARDAEDRRMHGHEDLVFIAEQEGAVLLMDRNAVERMLGREAREGQAERADYHVEDMDGFGVLNLEQAVEKVRQLRGGESVEIARDPGKLGRALLRRLVEGKWAVETEDEGGVRWSGYAIEADLVQDIEALLGKARLG